MARRWKSKSFFWQTLNTTRQSSARQKWNCPGKSTVSGGRSVVGAACAEGRFATYKALQMSHLLPMLISFRLHGANAIGLAEKSRLDSCSLRPSPALQGIEPAADLGRDATHTCHAHRELPGPARPVHLPGPCLQDTSGTEKKNPSLALRGTSLALNPGHPA